MDKSEDKYQIWRLRRNGRKVALQVFRRIRDNQRVPPIDYWAGKWLEDASDLIPEKIQELSDQCRATNTPESIVLYIFLRQIRDNIQASHLLLSLGLLEEYAVCIRRYIELLGTFLYVAGFSRFTDYLEGRLERIQVSQMLRVLPLKYDEQSKEFYRYLSAAVHPKGGEYAFTVVEKDMTGSVSDIELANIIHSLVSVFHRKHLMMLTSVIGPIVNLHNGALNAGTDSYEADKLKAFCFLFHSQERLEALYLMNNQHRFANRNYLRDTIADDSVFSLFEKHSLLSSELRELFLGMSFAFYMSHGKAPKN